MIELYRHQSSIIHQTDARVKIIFTLAFLVCLNLSPSGAWPAYILFFTFMLVEYLLSRLPFKVVLIRSLISLPFVLAAFPLLFTGPDPHVRLQVIGKFWLEISQPGLIRFTSIAVKTWISIFAAILLSSSTKFGDLLIAFRQIGLPKILVAIISLMWRYLSLMIDEAVCLMRARNSRSGSHEGKNRSGGSLWWRGSVTGKMAGNLMLRSLERSERVYAAMSSRGYNGEVLEVESQPLTTKDLSILFATSIQSVVILGIAFLLH